MLKGFKEFISRGNVMELAIAVVIGTATTAMVTAVVNNLIRPLIAAIGGTKVNGLAFHIIAGNDKSVIDIGAIITAVINFLIIAAAVYFFLVVPMKKIMDRNKKEEEAEPTETELLTEIRDLLSERKSN